ncbi:MAG: TldD/PmbA family protein [Lachnospiraceae bacterium]|nr:TldD/PmbA family protein [Lachnospiraceae bacterium]
MLENLLIGAENQFADHMSTELRAQENRYRTVCLQKGDMSWNSRTDVTGVSARVCDHGRYGFAASAEYTEASVRRVLRAATENAHFMTNKMGAKEMDFAQTPRREFAPGRPVAEAEQKRMIEICRQVDDYIVRNYPNLVSRYVGANEESAEKYLLTSDAGNGHSTLSRCYVDFSLAVEAPDGRTVELFDADFYYGGFGDNIYDFDAIYRKIDALYLKVMEKREGVYPETGIHTVILGGSLGGMLCHEAVGHTLEADYVRNGSVGGAMLGQTVASGLINITDFAHTYEGQAVPLPVYFDDEGVEAKDAVLIKDGQLVGYMNNREMAAYYGMEPTGNARASEYINDPIIRMRNTLILPGQDRLEDMIASVDDGYYLFETNNGQSMLNGEFLFGVVMGYEIKKGKLGRAILDTAVSGNAFDVLKSVDMVSDRITWCKTGTCGKKGQSIMVTYGGPEIRCKIRMGGR